MNYAPKEYYAPPAGVAPIGLPEKDALITQNPKTGEIAFHYNGEAPELVRKAITAVKNRLFELSDIRLELPVEHFFIDGVYVRKLFIPKGTLLVGKVHRIECVNIVSKGDISVLTESGSQRVKAGFHLVSPPGIQKIGFAHEDTIFTNVFRADEADPEKIENVVACDTYEQFSLLAIEGDTICQ